MNRATCRRGCSHIVCVELSAVAVLDAYLQRIERKGRDQEPESSPIARRAAAAIGGVVL